MFRGPSFRTSAVEAYGILSSGQFLAWTIHQLEWSRYGDLWGGLVVCCRDQLTAQLCRPPLGSL